MNIAQHSFCVQYSKLLNVGHINMYIHFIILLEFTFRGRLLDLRSWNILRFLTYEIVFQKGLYQFTLPPELYEGQSYCIFINIRFLPYFNL